MEGKLKRLVGITWGSGVLVGSIIFVDQTVKLFVTILGFESSTNYGISFGLFDTKNLFGFVLNLVGLAVLLMIIFMSFASKKAMLTNLQKMLLLVCLGASLSNFIDRVFRGGVIDFIRLPYLPTFNIADALITSSVIILILSLFKKENDSTNQS